MKYRWVDVKEKPLKIHKQGKLTDENSPNLLRRSLSTDFL